MPGTPRLAVSKLAAYREKDLEFAAALISAGLADTQILRDRINLLPVGGSDHKRLHRWVTAATARP